MKRLLSVLSATLVAFMMLVAPAYAKDKGDKADRGGSSAGQGGGSKGADGAGGLGKNGKRQAGNKQPSKPSSGAATSARPVAPPLADVRSGTKANVVEVNDLIKGKRRIALNRSLAANQAGLERLRASLLGLRLSGLSARDAGDAVATRREADGSVTVFVDRGAN